MKRRLTTLMLVIGLVSLTLPLPAQAIIHELVGSHCAGHDLPNNHANVDPPGQLNMTGKSFARALQASGVYDIQFGVNRAGTPGVDTTTDPPTVGPMPAPAAGTFPVTVEVDNTRPNAKLGDSFTWFFFVEPEAGLSVYIQIYELDHPAFEQCPRFVHE